MPDASDPPPPLWCPSRHVLGRGRFDPAGAHVAGGAARLLLPAGRPDGAEAYTEASYRHGRFRCRLRTARARGSLSAFFLYERAPGERNDEVDVEIPNDGSGRVLLTTWADGVRTNHRAVDAGFDPSEAFHAYEIEVRDGHVALRIDGAEAARWTDGLPTRPMRLHLSAWWPRWLAGAPPGEPRWTTFEDIEVRG